MSNIKKVIESGVEYDVETYNGDTWWRVDGELHRIDNPAFIGVEGNKEWWLEGVSVYGYLNDNTSKMDISAKMSMSIIKYKLKDI